MQSGFDVDNVPHDPAVRQGLSTRPDHAVLRRFGTESGVRPHAEPRVAVGGLRAARRPSPR
jgi:hypothetical protein